MNMKTYNTISMQLNHFIDGSIYTFWTKPYSRLVDVNIANNMLWATFEEPIDPMECNKNFTLSLNLCNNSTTPYGQTFYGMVKKLSVTTNNYVSGKSINIETDLIESLYMVYYTETKPQEEIRDERIEEVIG